MAMDRAPALQFSKDFRSCEAIQAEDQKPMRLVVDKYVVTVSVHRNDIDSFLPTTFEFPASSSALDPFPVQVARVSIVLIHLVDGWLASSIYSSEMREHEHVSD